MLEIKRNLTRIAQCNPALLYIDDELYFADQDKGVRLLDNIALGEALKALILKHFPDPKYIWRVERLYDLGEQEHFIEENRYSNFLEHRVTVACTAGNEVFNYESGSLAESLAAVLADLMEWEWAQENAVHS